MPRLSVKSSPSYFLGMDPHHFLPPPWSASRLSSTWQPVLFLIHRPHHHPHTPQVQNPSVTQAVAFGVNLFALSLDIVVTF